MICFEYWVSSNIISLFFMFIFFFGLWLYWLDSWRHDRKQFEREGDPAIQTSLVFDKIIIHQIFRLILNELWMNFIFYNDIIFRKASFNLGRSSTSIAFLSITSRSIFHYMWGGYFFLQIWSLKKSNCL